MRFVGDGSFNFFHTTLKHELGNDSTDKSRVNLRLLETEAASKHYAKEIGLRRKVQVSNSNFREFEDRSV